MVNSYRQRWQEYNLDNEYTTDLIAADAKAFADSRFGMHYLDRLNKAHARCMETVMDLDCSDSYRANMASKASAIRAEIEYFEIAQNIATNPTILERLRLKAERKKAPDINL